MNEIKASNRIYLTYKARIEAESRYRLYSNLANSLIIWYSFLMIVASIAVSSDEIQISYFETIFAASSIAIFASSVFLATGILQKRADEFRACYLELQRIWNSNRQEAAKMKQYNEAITRYPNHSPSDNYQVIFSTWLRGGSLFDTEGAVPTSCFLIFSVLIRKIVFIASCLFVFLGPILLIPFFVKVQ